jgi:hypothetical protein
MEIRESDPSLEALSCVLRWFFFSVFLGEQTRAPPTPTPNTHTPASTLSFTRWTGQSQQMLGSQQVVGYKYC